MSLRRRLSGELRSDLFSLNARVSLLVGDGNEEDNKANGDKSFGYSSGEIKHL